MSIITKCEHCATQNRVKADFSINPKCGNCHKEIQINQPKYPFVVDEEDFTTLISHAPKPVLVDFWAEWCGPCRMVAPVLEKFLSKYDHIFIAKLNVDQNQAIAVTYRISSIPTMILFDKGQPQKQLVGAMNLQGLERELNQWLN